MTKFYPAITPTIFIRSDKSPFFIHCNALTTEEALAVAERTPHATAVYYVSPSGCDKVAIKDGLEWRIDAHVKIRN